MASPDPDPGPACRILYLIGSLRCGGQERQLYYLLRALNKGQYPAGLAVWNLGKDDFFLEAMRALGLPIFVLREGPRLNKFAQWTRLVRDLAPQVIHSYSFYTNVLAQAGGSLARGRPSILGSLRISFFESLADNRWVGRLSARWPRRHISNSYAARREVEESSSYFRPREVYVVPNGVDLDFFQPTPLPPGPPVRLAAIGSLVPYKRWDVLLRALGLLKQTRPEWRLALAGSGPERTRLEALAQDLGIADRVELLGGQPDSGSLLTRSHFLVHSSDAEGMPNVIAEAMACGRAVVSTAAGDVPRMVKNERTGFVVERGDVRQLAERIEALLRDPALCERMGKRAREEAEAMFPLHLLVERTLGAYAQAGWRNV